MRYYLVLLVYFLISCGTQTNSKNEKIDFKTENRDRQENPDNSGVSPIDTNFMYFVQNFGFNHDFQIARTKFPIEFNSFSSKKVITKETWKHDRIFVDLEAITDVFNGTEMNEKTDERVFSWINTKSRVSRNYFFKRENSKWFMIGLSIEKNNISKEKEDFFDFLGKFGKDSIFQMERIQFPIDIIYLDDDFKQIEEKRVKEKWRFTSVFYNCDSIAVNYYDFKKTFLDTDERILMIHGNGNGIFEELTFRRVNNKWTLIKHVDIST